MPPDNIYMKANVFAEKTILKNIISGVWKPGEPLMSERELSAQLGITRPTLRETFQRLAREGWITISHGKQTVVNNFLEDGGLGILKTLSLNSDLIPRSLINDWLEFRIMILPELTLKTLEKNSKEMLIILNQKPDIEIDAIAFTIYDWELQSLIIKSSENAIFKMIFNDIKTSYFIFCEKYFSITENRENSYNYYQQLEKSFIEKSGSIISIVRNAMIDSKDRFNTF